MAGLQSTAIIDFGAFPGKSDTSLAVASPTIAGTSLVEAWLYPVATADHSADEHMLETIRVIGSAPNAGVGFTIYAFNTSQLSEPTDEFGLLGRAGANLGRGAQDQQNMAAQVGGGQGTRIYGQWTVGWVWNG